MTIPPRAVRGAAALAASMLLLRDAAAQPSACPALLPPAPAPPAALATALDALRRAVAARDAAAFRSLAAPDIRLDLGDALTLDDLGFDRPGSPAWARLDRALSLGCRPASATAWECPGLGLLDPPAARGIEPELRVFVIGGAVALRAAPSAEAPVLARLSCAVAAYDLDAPGAAEDRAWIPLRLGDGRRGHVASRFAHPASGWRLMLEHRDGAWRVTHFLAGD